MSTFLRSTSATLGLMPAGCAPRGTPEAAAAATAAGSAPLWTDCIVSDPLYAELESLEWRELRTRLVGFWCW